MSDEGFTIETTAEDVLRTVEEIQRHSAPAIEGYKAFLLTSQDPEEREYTDDAQQIEEVLVKEFYMSSSDIAFCRDYDISGLAGEPGFAAIQTLHKRLADLYPQEEEADPNACVLGAFRTHIIRSEKAETS